ncbi:MAG: rhomboid family intramembrane serine protease [Owenweeksia sp.]
MGDIGVIEIILIASNVLLSFKGFNDRIFFSDWAFQVGKVLGQKDYKRLITSGFLHVSTMHLIFNMLTLYFFAGALEAFLGPFGFIVVYFGSLVGGNLFALLVHQKNWAYSAVGASGAVSGVVFAAIALFPGMKLALFLIPIPMPAWLFGLGFILYSIFGIKSQRDNIGHEAHLGGAVIGLLIAIAFRPEMLSINTLSIMLVLIPALSFMLVVLFRPSLLSGSANIRRSKPAKTTRADEHYNSIKAEKKRELDRILDKIKEQGMDSLTEEEKWHLDTYGDNL